MKSWFSDAVKHFYRQARYLSLGQNRVPLRIQVWVSHPNVLTLTLLLQFLPLSFTSFHLLFLNHFLHYLYSSRTLSLSPPTVCCITSLNSYGLINYLHKLLFYRDLLNILPRTRGVQNVQCHWLSPSALHTIQISQYSASPDLRENFTYTINILCDGWGEMV